MLINCTGYPLCIQGHRLLQFLLLHQAAAREERYRLKQKGINKKGRLEDGGSGRGGKKAAGAAAAAGGKGGKGGKAGGGGKKKGK